MKLNITCPKCRQQAFKLDAGNPHAKVDAVCTRCSHVFTKEEIDSATLKAGEKAAKDAMSKMVRDFNSKMR